MAKALLGLLIGIALTTIVFVMLPQITQQALVDVPLDSPSPQVASQSEAAVASAEANPASDSFAGDRPESAGDRPPEEPISLPPEFDWLSDGRSENHHAIQREPIDPEWSATTRSQIENFFLDRPELFEKFGYPIIHCRTTRCEAAFVVYGVNEAEADAAARTEGLETEFFSALRFRTEVSEFAARPVAAQFAPIKHDDLDVRVEDGVTTILWHLSTR